MALIHCSECDRQVSDKAVTCPGCGAPINGVAQATAVGANMSTVRYVHETDTFAGSMVMIVKLAMRAVQDLGWKIDQANEALGLVTFQTGMSWGSWSGVSCSLNIEEVAPSQFKISGTGKQNLSGGQLIALNIGGEAKKKAQKAIEKMKEFAS